MKSGRGKPDSQEVPDLAAPGITRQSQKLIPERAQAADDIKEVPDQVLTPFVFGN